MIRSPHVLMIDNFDSFTFNLVDEFSRRGCEVTVWRNDSPLPHLLDEIGRLKGLPRLLVLSPGPGTPKAAGCSVPLVRQAAGRIPILGVCLGHQAIIEAFDGEVGFAGEVVHGRASPVTHDGDPLFHGITSPFVVGRYHSLAGTRIRSPIRAIAHTGDIVMAVRHAALPVIGVQFHPESVLTPEGGRLLENVLTWAGTLAKEPDGKEHHRHDHR